MDLTIEKMKVGDGLLFGRYGVSNDHPQPITWLKTSPNCGFITENAVDYLCFDAQERSSDNRNMQYAGNPDLSLSNLFGFLNSADEQWYHPTHQTDAPPSRNNTDRYREYESHFGFLYYFDEYELESLLYNTVTVGNRQITSLVRPPLISEVLGANRLKLFTKRGVRPKGTEDMIQNRQRTGFDYNSYIDFWVIGSQDNARALGTAISRSGATEERYPSHSSGVRPVCHLKPETEVVLGDDGFYRIKPRIIKQNVYTDEELLCFLGIAQP